MLAGRRHSGQPQGRPTPPPLPARAPGRQATAATRPHRPLAGDEGPAQILRQRQLPLNQLPPGRVVGERMHLGPRGGQPLQQALHAVEVAVAGGLRGGGGGMGRRLAESAGSSIRAWLGLRRCMTGPTGRGPLQRRGGPPSQLQMFGPAGARLCLLSACTRLPAHHGASAAHPYSGLEGLSPARPTMCCLSAWPSKERPSAKKMRSSSSSSISSFSNCGRVGAPGASQRACGMTGSLPP